MTFFWSLENEKRAGIIRIESGKDDKVSHLSLEKEAQSCLCICWAKFNFKMGRIKQQQQKKRRKSSSVSE